MKNSMLFSLSKQTGKLASIIEEIVRIADPEKILLLSVTYNYQLKENIFIKNPMKDYSGVCYDLLALSEGKDAKTLIEQEITISMRLRNQVDLHLHMLDVHEFNRLIKAGDEYFRFLLLNAFIPYDRGHIPLEYPMGTG
jgi:hypothetical protein